MELRCVKCGHKVEKLYIQYSPGNIRLVKCEECRSVADEYIECELMILIIDLILHKPKAYRHLLFNSLYRNTLDFNSLLLKSSLVFLLLDTYKLLILSEKSQELLNSSFALKISACALFGNLVFLFSLYVMSRRLLNFVEGFRGFKDVLLAVVISSYLKVYLLAMLVWDFPTSVVYIIDLLVMSSNLVALSVITESSFRRCIGNQFTNMETNKSTETKVTAAAPTPAMASCRKKKSDDATFLEDIKDHIDEFIHASMDEHKTCFTKTIQKMFGMSKIVAQRSSEQQEVESILPLQTTVAK